MVSIDLSEYKALYLQTAKEYVDQFRKDLDSFEKDAKNHEIVKRLHLSVHSLKSQSLIMGYTGIGVLAGTLEQVFRQVMDRSLALDSSQLFLLKQSADTLSQSIEHIARGEKLPKTTDQIQKLERAFSVRFTH